MHDRSREHRYGAHPIPNDGLSSAEHQVARTKSELDAARERARRIGECTDWLANRPDLARLDHLIKDQPRRLSQFKREQEKYNHACQIWQQNNLPKIPADLKKDIKYFRWLDRLQTGFNREHLRRCEQELSELKNAHYNALRPEMEKELSPLKQQLDNAAAALSEANAAMSRQPEIDQFKASCIEAFVAERSRTSKQGTTQQSKRLRRFTANGGRRVPLIRFLTD
jgi:hypothetical protein